MNDDPEATLKKAEELTLSALRADPNNGNMRAQLGYIQKDLAGAYSRQGRTARAQQAMEDAEATFAEVLKANAQDASALNGLGNIRAMRGDSDAAIEYYERATKLEPDYTYAWYDFALSLHEKYGQRSGKDLATLQKLTGVVLKVLELQTAPGPIQRLPDAAFDYVLKLKDQILREVERVKSAH